MLLEHALAESESIMNWIVQKGRKEDREIIVRLNPSIPGRAIWAWNSEGMFAHWPEHSRFRVEGDQVVHTTLTSSPARN